MYRRLTVEELARLQQKLHGWLHPQGLPAEDERRQPIDLHTPMKKAYRLGMGRPPETTVAGYC